MKNLLRDHPSSDVRQAAVRLADALCMWERSTGRDNLVIVRCTSGCEYRALSGSPVPQDIADSQLIEGFAKLQEEQPPI